MTGLIILLVLVLMLALMSAYLATAVEVLRRRVTALENRAITNISFAENRDLTLQRELARPAF